MIRRISFVIAVKSINPSMLPLDILAEIKHYPGEKVKYKRETYCQE
jgi:hypothetical protein